MYMLNCKMMLTMEQRIKTFNAIMALAAQSIHDSGFHEEVRTHNNYYYVLAVK